MIHGGVQLALEMGRNEMCSGNTPHLEWCVSANSGTPCGYPYRPYQGQEDASRICSSVQQRLDAEKVLVISALLLVVGFERVVGLDEALTSSLCVWILQSVPLSFALGPAKRD